MIERLSELVDAFNEGMRKLEKLDRERARLRDELLRASGAIEMLREIADAPGCETSGKEERLTTNGT